MIRFFIVAVSLVISVLGMGQELTGPQLLDKTIEYHDPYDAWRSFHAQLSITTETPNRSDRISDILLNLSTQYFKLTVKRNGNIVEQILDKDKCSLTLNGSTSFSEEDTKTHGLTCERAGTMKDYYTYLYGLPMKLRDSGAILNPKIQTRTFKGREYLVLKVNYKEQVGKDTWYFYFDPKTYAMKVYRFFHDESKNDGEYILLSGEEEVSGIRMPKTRTWYYNKDDKYLGADILTKTSSQ